jgi:hypothetical protein
MQPPPTQSSHRIQGETASAGGPSRTQGITGPRHRGVAAPSPKESSRSRRPESESDRADRSCQFVPTRVLESAASSTTAAEFTGKHSSRLTLGGPVSSTLLRRWRAAVTDHRCCPAKRYDVLSCNPPATWRAFRPFSGPIPITTATAIRPDRVKHRPGGSHHAF